VVAGILIGQLFDDRYEVVKKLGSGYAADVYLAYDRVLRREVALKVVGSRLADDEQFLKRFRRETGRAAGLDHPNVAQIGHRGQAKGAHYVAVEYLGERSLQAIIIEHAPLDADFVTSVSLQVLEALRFAHRQNVVHGDVKPQNIFVDSEGGIKVTDFGMARAARRPVDAASDLYSLGAVMYQMATGSRPFEGDDVASGAGKRRRGEPAAPRTLNPLIPSDLDAIIMRSLGLGPGNRYLTAQAMLEDVRLVAEGEPASAQNDFAEEATRMVATTAAAEGADELEVGRPAWAGRPPDEPAPLIESEEKPGRPRHAWPWVLATILIVVCVAAAYVVISDRSATAKPQFGSVPDVVGLPEAGAIAKIQAAGFGQRIEGRESSADVDEGAVVRQTTAAGTKLEKGKAVGIWVSLGTGQADVPKLVGLTQAEAADKLSEAGLEMVTKPEVDPEVEVGRVLRQNPEAGKKVDPGTTVTITVAAVTNTVKVPPLAGMTQESAVALLKGLSLLANVQEIDSALPGGTVDHQDPASATEVQPGATVNVFVSNAAAATTVRVPSVGALELTETEAKAILAKYRLKANVIDLETPDSKPGLCIYQDPAAGVEVKINSVVNITIARKPAPTTTTIPSPAPGVLRYDQTDTHIAKTGVWADRSTVSAYLGSYGRSSTHGASATVYFSGTRLDWIAVIATNAGIVDVYVDGVKTATVDLAAPATTYMVNVWSTGALARGHHRVTLELSSGSPSGKYLTLDAVDVWGTIRGAP
jgi:eukaryotic-like serine/threonine-protein kinase